MDDFLSDVVANILEQFSLAALVAVLLINLGSEIVARIRNPRHRGHLGVHVLTCSGAHVST